MPPNSPESVASSTTRRRLGESDNGVHLPRQSFIDPEHVLAAAIWHAETMTEPQRPGAPGWGIIDVVPIFTGYVRDPLGPADA